MHIVRKHKLAAGAAALVTAAGTGGAIAATGASTPRHQFLSDAAARLHVSDGQLQSALTGAYEDRLNAAVAAGQLTRAQAQHIEARLRHGGTPFLRFGSQRRGLRAGLIRSAASYLAMTPQQLRAARKAGKSLAQIAQAQGKTVSGLESAITAALKARLDHAVVAGRLTSEQEQKVLANLPKRLNRLVNRTS